MAPMIVKKLPSLDRINELVEYDPNTGLFKSKPGVRIRGDYLKKGGYRYIRIDCEEYTAARIAWLIVYGREPQPFIDHINRDISDNRISNLREATKSQNGANSRGRTMKAQPKGVTSVDGKWQVQIRCHGRSYYLGRFSTAEEGNAVYKAKAEELFGEYARAAG
jgi:hypothetical protein